MIYSKFWPLWPPTPDARVPESEINLKFWPPTPEQIFVHRNIAKYVAQEHSLILRCARYRMSWLVYLTTAIRPGPCVIPLFIYVPQSW